MPDSFMSAFHFPPSVSSRELAVQLSRHLGMFDAHGLKPPPFHESAWRAGSPRIFTGWSLVHEEFARASGAEFWGADFIVLPAKDIPALILCMTTPSSPNPEAWRWLTDLAEELCDATGASFGCSTGFTPGRGQSEGTGAPPMGRDFSPGKPPSALCPWMYWGSTSTYLRPALE